MASALSSPRGVVRACPFERRDVRAQLVLVSSAPFVLYGELDLSTNTAAARGSAAPLGASVGAGSRRVARLYARVGAAPALRRAPSLAQ